MLADFFTLGKHTAKGIIQLLHIIGYIPMLIYAISIGGMASTAFPVDGFVKTGDGSFAPTFTPNYFLGGFTGILAFVVLAVVWKIACELLLLIFKSLEVYIHKNNPTP